MEYKKIHFLINPTSGGGSAGKTWVQIQNFVESKIGEFSFEFTTSKGQGKEIAFQAARNGVEKLIIIGGDGTISEAVTGVRASGSLDIVLGVLNLGTGGDFCKTLGVPGDIKLALDKIQSGRVVSIDIGVVNYLNHRGQVEERNFINITGCGMSGKVVTTINQSKKRFGGFSYYLASLQNFFSYKNQKVQVILDDKAPREFTIVNLAICNGQYFGGGMQISPKSQLTDGLLDVVIVDNWNAIQKIFYSPKLYNGSILNAPGVYSFTAKKVKVVPIGDSECLIDNDGEDVGRIPMEVYLIPSAVKFLV